MGRVGEVLKLGGEAIPGRGNSVDDSMGGTARCGSEWLKYQVQGRM